MVEPIDRHTHPPTCTRLANGVVPGLAHTHLFRVCFGVQSFKY
jgi:hypothetical protein